MRSRDGPHASPVPDVIGPGNDDAPPGPDGERDDDDGECVGKVATIFFFLCVLDLLRSRCFLPSRRAAPPPSSPSPPGPARRRQSPRPRAGRRRQLRGGPPGLFRRGRHQGRVPARRRRPAAVPPRARQHRHLALVAILRAQPPLRRRGPEDRGRSQGRAEAGGEGRRRHREL